MLAILTLTGKELYHPVGGAAIEILWVDKEKMVPNHLGRVVLICITKYGSAGRIQNGPVDNTKASYVSNSRDKRSFSSKKYVLHNARNRNHLSQIP